MSDLIFLAGGESVERYGTVVWKQSTAQDNAATFTRSGTVGTYIGGSGYLLNTDADIPRVQWLDRDEDGDTDTAYLNLESAHTNVVGEDNISTQWTDAGTSTTVTTGVADPANGTGAYSIVGPATANSGRYRAVTFTASNPRVATFVVKEHTHPSSGNQVLGIYDSTAAAWRLKLDITAWSSGKPTITATTGTHIGTHYIGQGFWAVYGRTTSVTHGNTHRAQVYSNEAASAGTITVYKVNVFDTKTPLFSVLDASQALNAETWYADFVQPPCEMTVYVKGIEHGSVDSGSNAGLVHIGNAANSGARFRIDSTTSSSGYRAVHHNGTDIVTATASGTITPGQEYELRAVLSADGSVAIGQSIAGAAETVSTGTTANAMPTAWANPRIYLNSRGTNDRAVALIRSVKVARGTKSMREMRSL